MNKRIATEKTDKTDLTRINKKKFIDNNSIDIKNTKFKFEKSDLKSEEERGIESDKRIVMVLKKEKDKKESGKKNHKNENEIINKKEDKKEIDIDQNSIEKEIELNTKEVKNENEKEIQIDKKEKPANNEIEKDKEIEKDINIIIIDKNEDEEEDKENEEKSSKENKSNIDKKNENNKVKDENNLFVLDKHGLCIFAFGAIVGIFVGAIKIPLSKKGLKGSTFNLTTTGGVLITCLILGHLGKICKLSLKVEKKILEDFRELGLILFLLGTGIAGGTKFIEYFKAIYFIYGIIITILPLLFGFFFNKYILKLYLFNNLGSLTGAMTSTPALGTLINVAKTDYVGNAYAATYPISLISVVIAAQFMVLLMK